MSNQAGFFVSECAPVSLRFDNAKGAFAVPRVAIVERVSKQDRLPASAKDLEWKVTVSGVIVGVFRSKRQAGAFAKKIDEDAQYLEHLKALNEDQLELAIEVFNKRDELMVVARDKVAAEVAQRILDGWSEHDSTPEP